MFGTLLNNAQIIALRESGDIKIDPFDATALYTVHYPLEPKAIFKRKADGQEEMVYRFSKPEEVYVVPANEYVLVEVREHIEVGPGIIGKFVTASNLIEKGFAIVAGRIEHPYGLNGEPVRFGLKNFLSEPNPIEADTRLAYIEFFDLRGTGFIPVSVPKEERERYLKRRVKVADDGVIYPNED